MLSYGRIYSETLVWEWDSIAKKRGDLIGQDTHGEDCLYAHFNMVQRLFDTGKCEEPDDEEPTVPVAFNLIPNAEISTLEIQ